MEIFTYQGFIALLQVISIDLVLAGDNAIVIGLAAAGLPKEQRNKAILAGIAIAAVLRIIFALITTWLLNIPGLLLVGGLVLLWVTWNMWNEMRAHKHESASDHGGHEGEAPPRKTLWRAITQITIADVSMSLDNVLAVAGAARDHVTVLIIGLTLSVLLMGLAAKYIAELLNRHKWFVYLGIAIILYVALSMTWEGAKEVLELVRGH